MAQGRIVSDELLQLIRARSCVAFVGAGISAPVYPTWQNFLKSLCEKANDRGVKTDASRAALAANLPLAYSLLRSSLHEKKLDGELTQWVRDAFHVEVFQQAPKENRDRVEKRFENLLFAPWKGIVTTNWDPLLNLALEKQKRSMSARVYSARDDKAPLGSILHSDPTVSMGGPWAIYLHGEHKTLNAEGTDRQRCEGNDHVLSTEDFEDFYANPRIDGFVTALLLSSCLVFVGCSLDDAIVRRRRVLKNQMGSIAPDWALLERTAANENRQGYLENVVGLKVVLYDNGDENHDNFDKALKELAECADDQRADDMHKDKGESMFARYARETAETLGRNILDTTNLALLELVETHRALPHGHIVAPARYGVHLTPELRAISANERFYRIAFLHLIQLVTEAEENGVPVYRLSAKGAAALQAAKVPV